MKNKTRNKVIYAVVMALVAGVCALYLTACETLHVRGSLETDYGTLSTDGKVLDVTARLPFARGYLK